MEAADVDKIVESDEIATTRALFSVERFVLIRLVTEVSDELTVLRAIEKEFKALMRLAFSVEITELSETSYERRDVFILPSLLLTVEIDTTRVLISDDNVEARMVFVEVNALVAVDNETDADETDEMRLLISVDNTVDMLLSATARDDTAVLNAVETDVTALTRFTTSVDNAVDVFVISAITLAIFAKLGFVFNSFAISASVSKLEGAVPTTLDNAEFNALVAAETSLLNEVESPDTTTDNEEKDALNAVETDSTWLVCTDISVEMAPLKISFELTRWEITVLVLVTKDESALTRVDASLEMPVLKLEFVEITLDTFVLVVVLILVTSLVSATDSVLNAVDVV